MIDPVDGVIKSEIHDKLGIAMRHLADLAKDRNSNETTSAVGAVEHNAEISSITDSPITWSEVARALKSCKNGKAGGVDEIPAELYKVAEEDVTPVHNFSKRILAILQACLEFNQIPHQWSQNSVVLV